MSFVKKTISLCLLAIETILVGFPFFEVRATDSEILTCPREIPDFTQEPTCGTDRVFETFSKSFLKEVEGFKNDALDPALQDNKSNSNWMAEKIVYELRQHRACLEGMCYKIYQDCVRETLSKSSFSDQYNWCEDKINRLMQVQIEAASAAVIENQARKERSLLREKFRAIEVRMIDYFGPLLADLIRQSKRFVEKVTNTIKEPL